MDRRDPSTFRPTVGLALATLVAISAAACGASKKEVERARHSVYDTEFVRVYNAALEATRALYPTLDENPGPGRIATAWHQVQYSNCAGAGSTCDDLVNPQVLAQQQGVGTGGNTAASMAAGMPTRLAYKRYYIRFDVSVLGGRPWRVKVKGHASEWEPGAAMPVEMKGAARPHWLEGRTQALQIAIYRRIKQFAVPMKELTPIEDEHVTPKTDPHSFAGLPDGAAQVLAAIKDALVSRAYTPMRALLADDVAWSAGGGTGADAAMALWQADPTSFDAMGHVIAGGCAVVGPNRVACPAGAPTSGAYQLVLEARGAAWRVTSFVKAE